MLDTYAPLPPTIIGEERSSASIFFRLFLEVIGENTRVNLIRFFLYLGTCPFKLLFEENH